MLGFELILLLVIMVMVLAPLARRLDVPLPVVQVMAGLFLSAIPKLADLQFDPELVFLIFVPPLLYWSCITSSMRELSSMRHEIGALAVGAVVITIAAVACVSHFGLPHLPWAPAVVLGAVVSPPDAAVTITIARRLGLPRRLVSLLEGETLFNDVTAFTAYRLAIAAAMTGSFAAGNIIPTLLYTAFGAFTIGWLVAHAIIWLRGHIADPIVANTLSLMTAYAAYLPAEWAGTSGVVAVVTTGLILGRRGPRLIDAATRVQAQQVWPLVLFVLNGLIFLLIGLQIGTLGTGAIANNEWPLLGAAGLICAVVIIVRVAFVVLGSWAHCMIRCREGMRRGTLSETLFIAWTGIRGGDTLVTALAIPLTIDEHTPVPVRHAMLVISFAVILVTLVVQGLTLRPLMRRATMTADESEIDEDRLARRELSLAGVARLSELAVERKLPDDIAKQIQTHHHMRRHVRSGSEQQPDNVGSSILASQLLDINRKVLKAERDTILRLRDEGSIGDDILRNIQREIDLEELVMMRKAEDI